MNNDVIYDPVLAAEFADRNHDDVKKSKNVGCFSCVTIIPSKFVVNFLMDGSACCPMCGDKSVIPDVLMPLTTKNLSDLHVHWYRKKR